MKNTSTTSEVELILNSGKQKKQKNDLMKLKKPNFNSIWDRIDQNKKKAKEKMGEHKRGNIV